MSRVWKQLNWVVLAQGILWGCSQDVSQGCSYLKGRGANSRMSYSGGSQNSPSYFQEASVPHPLDVFIELLQLFHDWLSPEYVTQESKIKTPVSFMTWPWKYSVIYAIFYWLYRSAWFSMGGDRTEYYYQGGRKYWGSFQRLVTTPDVKV